jgi:ferrous iron transport protein B
MIDIVDATNIERNLYLTLQLMELGIPMVIALNMMDEVRKSGNAIDVLALENALGVPVVPISASKNEGTQELLDHVVRAAREKAVPKKLDFCKGEVHKAIHSIAHIVEDKAKRAGYSPRFSASKLIEGDKILEKELGLSENERDIIGHVAFEMEQALGTDREAALADMRYAFIEDICAAAVTKNNETGEYLRSEKIDAVLTHRVFAIPIFLSIMFFIFWLTFEVFGPILQDLLSGVIDAATGAVSAALGAAHVSAWMHSLLINGVFAGVGSVLSFLPIIVLLFFFLSLLEDTGYMARVAFTMDKLLRKIGLSGRSFVPMLMGFGCSVPAIMATRTLASERDRRMTIILTPFMSCSAKLPVYALITAAFFPDHRALIMIGLYVLGLIVAVLSGLLLKNTVFRGKPVPFVMELPSYRMPSLKSSLLLMWEKARDFLQRAFTVIFVATIVIWFLQNLDFGFNMVFMGCAEQTL